MVRATRAKCVNCHRCVALCPTRALENRQDGPHLPGERQLVRPGAIEEVYRQAESGGVLLSSMGNPKSYPVYWEQLLLNASQVTNPSIDPLREPMETRDLSGPQADPSKLRVDERTGNVVSPTCRPSWS